MRSRMLLPPPPPPARSLLPLRQRQLLLLRHSASSCLPTCKLACPVSSQGSVRVKDLSWQEGLSVCHGAREEKLGAMLGGPHTHTHYLLAPTVPRSRYCDLYFTDETPSLYRGLFWSLQPPSALACVEGDGSGSMQRDCEGRTVHQQSPSIHQTLLPTYPPD